MSDEHWSCKNLKLSIRQEPGAVWLKLAEPLAMREVEVKCEVNESTISSRQYHVRESVVLGARRLLAEALDQGMIQISLRGALGVFTASNFKVPLVKWEPQEEDIFGSLIPPE